MLNTYSSIPHMVNANKCKFDKKIVRMETQAYQGRFQDEINQDREIHGKNPFPPVNLIGKKPRRLKKVPRILKVATM
ncbi:hypothetical protein ACIQY5_08070 [Peribacillus frigoritolerans]|uniref:hypothetical protein n=1 Tax=Peribacillus frigoritolerans TaxID=450367 RepID=UPI00382CFF43